MNGMCQKLLNTYTAASVHGVVSRLSLVKDNANEKTKWFDVRLINEGKSVRLVSCDPSLTVTFNMMLQNMIRNQLL